MAYKVESLPNAQTELGEGPHWDIGTQSLYFIDIVNPTIFRYDFKENKTYQTTIVNETGSSFVIPIENTTNQFAVGLGRHVGIVEWDGCSSTCNVIGKLFEVEQDDDGKKFKDNRFNDAKADPKGRFYGGTMFQDKTTDVFENRLGNFYRWQKGHSPVKLKENIGISNGLTWNTNLKKFYYIDSADFNIMEYDYDINTGEISNPKILIDFKIKGDTKRPSSLPDGMTIDSNGFLYVAKFGGSKVLKINPKNGNVEMEINIPASHVTSVAFGGPNLDILYVTTAAIGQQPNPAGRTFQVTGLNAKGLEMTKLKT